MTYEEIAQGIIDYSYDHEEDALASKKGFCGWETPVYCWGSDREEKLEHALNEVKEHKWTTLKEAITYLTDLFQTIYEIERDRHLSTRDWY